MEINVGVAQGCQHRMRSSDFCVVSVTASFVNFFMHSPER